MIPSLAVQSTKYTWFHSRCEERTRSMEVADVEFDHLACPGIPYFKEKPRIMAFAVCVDTHE